MTKPPKPDTRNPMPHGIASQVAEYFGTCGRILSKQVGEGVGMRSRNG